MKIAICTLFHKNYNYGGILQAYALQQVLKNIGFDSDIIRFDNEKSINPIYPTLVSRLAQYSIFEIVDKVWEIIRAKFDVRIKAKLKKRISLYEQFVNKCTNTSDIYNDTNINDIASQYDILISGSDQVWNPNSTNNLFLQNFDTKNRRVSYAASISRNQLSQSEKKVLIPALARFDYISVREKTAKELLRRELPDKDIEIVCDPTLMLSPSQWDTIASKRIIDKPYILIYAFSKCKYIDDIVMYCKKNNLECYYIPYAKHAPNSFDETYPITPLFDIGPSEFVSLIKNSEGVVTDSFHGTVFSIIYGKNFFVYERDGKKGKTSKNSRIYDLLSTFNIENALIKKDIDWSCKIDYSKVKPILTDLQNASLNWLKSAVG